ncbi:outer membrane receptor protein involved in Fe transport [Blastomonas natatoria]|uniref:Outer membrane receptor protein involved in Fe transport n=1 Tax=Blastomonas natatoria TaxID=34015 RepID=A0A2V3VAH0_9SPHN|nr:TonB-dependent receptor [Blastomonas natatoria]PXW73729.1 outer membrane receptor protein involved in Fe transport [Blastomonas natatoria]
MKIRYLASVAAIALAGLPAMVRAQEAGPATPASADQTATPLRSFDPAYFTQFAPRTALDMVRQIPGFSIAEGEDRRGLGQVSSNVLINGERFSGKSNDAVSELGRIGAANVIRIELIDGATLNLPGLTGQVVNIVSKVDSLTGQFRYSPRVRFRRTDPQLLNGEVSVSGKAGKIAYTLSLANNSFRNGNAGTERVLDAAGNVTDRRYEELYVNGDEPRIAAGIKYTGDTGQIGNLNLAYQRRWVRITEDSDGEVVRDRDYLETEKENNYEIGGDYLFPLWGGNLKLIGLRRFEHSPFFTRIFLDFEDRRPREGNSLATRIDETETIARAEYGWKAGKADWQFSLEGAINKLDTDAELKLLDTAGRFNPVPLPGSDATVEEKRAEIGLSYGRPLSSNLTLQTSIGGEYSQIMQSGPNGLTRSFIRPKGFVSLAWKPVQSLDLSLRLQRDVGQLNFFDFVASADLGAENQNSGNPDLVPQQSWNIDFQATKNLGALGSINAKAFVNFVEDIVDQVPIGATGEAPGNIDSATIWGVSIDSTFKMDVIGWTGVRFDIDYTYRKSSLPDPLTGINRRISGDLIHEFSAEFRYDIPGGNWAVGANYFDFSQADEVRLSQLAEFPIDGGDLGFYVENKDVRGLTVRLGLSNLIGTNEAFRRTFYVARRDGPVAFVEDRDRFFGPVVRLDINGSF